ncbi:MAG: DUF268 domain-containing protein [Candidatus Yonathbacteria bacterium]|nr:DUF268 domain-containing protein [Candidatus Yonathbacteria bacterium]
MKKIIKKTIRLFLTPFVLMDFLKFWKQDKNPRFSLLLSDFYPCIKDKTVKTGFDRHYVYHTSWAARKVKEINPPFHTDISSSLYFAGIVSAFVPVKFYDYRPAQLKLSGVESGACDLTKMQFKDNSIKSLSCMHTVEHIGLGRYGDTIDPNGDIKATRELSRVLTVGGHLIFVVPVGKPKIEFNAHRIYSYEQVPSLFPDLKLVEFSMVTDMVEQGDFIKNADPNLVQYQNYACGCFLFKK